jgi:hypothetical protein
MFKFTTTQQDCTPLQKNSKQKHDTYVKGVTSHMDYKQLKNQKKSWDLKKIKSLFCIGKVSMHLKFFI